MLKKEKIYDNLKDKFPEVFKTDYICFAPFIDENMSFISEGDNIIFDDDTEYTITSLLAICQKTKKPIIVTKKNENTDNDIYIKVFIQEIK